MSDADIEEKQNAETGTLLTHKTEPQKSLSNETATETETELMGDSLELSKDVTCGFWIFKNEFLQRCANDTFYMILYGLMNCMMAMVFAFYNGTMTTMEKRFKIPSRLIGMISVGNDISTMCTSVFLSYYSSGRHRPRWMGIGMLTVVGFCLLTAAPHFIYGGGEDALRLTYEYGGNSTMDLPLLEAQPKDNIFCTADPKSCAESTVDLTPPTLLFIAQLVGGTGAGLLYTLGLTYMDDNTTKSKSPAMITWATFLRMLGPLFGFGMASYCLRQYIEPHLHPVITDKDPRWLGAWWLGWIFLAVVLTLTSVLLFMFPKELPRTRARRLAALRKNAESHIGQPELSFNDMLRSIKRLLTNKVYIYNKVSSLFYCFGYMPYWMFMPKYMEIQYRQTAATASMVTGAAGLAFAATSVLLAGYVITKYKPSARKMCLWNCFVNIITICGLIGYMFISCDDSDSLGALTNLETKCSSGCHCDYVPFTPVCGEDNATYISPCHAGCQSEYSDSQGAKYFSECKCIGEMSSGLDEQHFDEYFKAKSGICPVDCHKPFLAFLAVMCSLKLIVPSAGSTGMLIALRSVEERDKTFAMGLQSMMLSLMAFIPSPIFFGWLMDRYCLVWGKTCTSEGNCWLYDAQGIRYSLNLIAAGFMLISTFFAIPIWYYSKDVQIFDEEPQKKPKDIGTELVLVEKTEKV